MFNDFFKTRAYKSYINMLTFTTRTSNKYFYIKFRIILKIMSNIRKRLQLNSVTKKFKKSNTACYIATLLRYFNFY